MPASIAGDAWPGVLAATLRSERTSGLGAPHRGNLNSMRTPCATASATSLMVSLRCAGRRQSSREAASSPRRDADHEAPLQIDCLKSAQCTCPISFFDGFDRLIAFNAETTGKRTPDADFVRRQPFAWRAPGIIIEVGFVEMLRDGEAWRKGATWSSRVNPDGPIDPEAIKIHRSARGAQTLPRFPTILREVKTSLETRRSWPTLTRTSKNIDYEFARAKVIHSGMSAYAEERYICTQLLFAQLFPGAVESLDFDVRSAGARSQRARRSAQPALLDARHDGRCAHTVRYTGLRRGESGAPRSWTST